jgi:hypothetical protein
MWMELLHEITAFCGRTGMPVTKFGRLAVNDPRLVSDMRRGRELRPTTCARVRRFIAGRAS